MTDPNSVPKRGHEVIAEDGKAGMDRLKDLTRRLLSIPKAEVDAAVAKAKRERSEGRKPGRGSQPG